MTTTSFEVRRVHFSRFVRRALDRAKSSRGWSIERAAKEAGIGSSTLHRWLDGDFEKAPRADLVEAFCDVLDIPTRIPMGILWPGKGGDQQMEPEPLPLPVSDTIAAIQRKLADPNISDREKGLINDTLDFLAGRRSSK